jgi:hypothetical protein
MRSGLVHSVGPWTGSAVLQVGRVFGYEPVRGNPAVWFQGLALSTGVTAAVNERFFVRPEVRWRLIGPGPIMLTTPVVSAGYRF